MTLKQIVISFRQTTVLPSGFLSASAALGALMIIWEGLVRLMHVPVYLLPPPTAILLRIWSNHVLIAQNAWVTLLEVLAGFLFGGVVGFVIAAMIIYSRLVEQIVMPVALFFQTTPKLAVAPLFLIWFGYGILPKVLVAVLMCVFPVLISSVSGLRSTDKRLLELMFVLRASWWQVFWKARFPGALPHLFAGLKVAITLSVIGAIVGEWVGSSAGLGHLILAANSQLDTELVFASVATLAIMGSLLYLLVQKVEEFWLIWEKPISAADKV